MQRMDKQIKEKGMVKKAFLAAFPHTIPIFAGFWFLGLTYGIYMSIRFQFLVSDAHEPDHLCRFH